MPIQFDKEQYYNKCYKSWIAEIARESGLSEEVVREKHARIVEDTHYDKVQVMDVLLAWFHRPIKG